MSQSEFEIVFEFEGGVVLRGVLDRVLGPLIVEDLISKLPIDGRATLFRDEMRITLGISRGNLKPVHEVKKGEIAYMPLGDSLCIYLKNMSTFSQVNVIGHVAADDETLEKLRRVRRGCKVTIRK